MYRAAYFRVFLTFARNSLVRNMTFRANFIIEVISSVCWMLMNLGFYVLIFQYTSTLGTGGWGKYEFFVFLSTTLFINSLVEAFFMPNAEEFSELVRTGGLDFALLKPIDTQFLISLTKVDWSSFSNFFFACGLLLYSLAKLDYTPNVVEVLLYPVYVVCGVMILYSLMIAL
ncbi:MAG TPA: ABC-2 family transporter protein, partial [Pirellulales bacterium]